MHCSPAGPTIFSQKAIQGAKQAAKDNPAKLTVIIPEEGATDQTRKMLTLSGDDYEGIAISPLEPSKQARGISVLASSTLVVTYDNDAPDTLRHCHVGTNNYVAGRLCGRLIKEALPEGGSIALFVGDHERENARMRRQGLVDVLKGQDRTPGVSLDPVEGEIVAGDYTIVATYLDGSVPAKGKENAKLALEEHPDLDCMVGLYGYSAPMCLETLKEADKVGDIKVVAFDDFDATLKGIEDGHVFATVVQDPFQYGYEAVRLLVTLSQEKPHSIPYAGTGALYLPCQSVQQENLAAFRAKQVKHSPTKPKS